MEKELFTDLFYYYLPLLRSIGLRLTGNSFDCEDLLQDTYLRGFMNLQQINNDTNVKRWLLQIMKNIHTDQYYSTITRIRTVTTLKKLPLDTGWMRPDHPLNLRPYRYEIRTSLMNLHWKLRSAFLLKEEGCTYDEISSLTGVPPGTAASRVSRAKTALRKKLAPLAHAEAFKNRKQENNDF